MKIKSEKAIIKKIYNKVYNKVKFAVLKRPGAAKILASSQAGVPHYISINR
tara:strand:- start:583 stop:735 length:153 start_codon:yes stop_codon:yes gene_type:complete